MIAQSGQQPPSSEQVAPTRFAQPVGAGDEEENAEDEGELPQCPKGHPLKIHIPKGRSRQ